MNIFQACYLVTAIGFIIYLTNTKSNDSIIDKILIVLMGTSFIGSLLVLLVCIIGLLIG